MVKRKLYINIIGSYVKQKHAISATLLPLAEKRYQPLFPPRKHLLTSQNELLFLNVKRALTIPMDWHPKDMKYGTRLWLLNLHYMEFLEALDDTDFYMQVLDWVDKNKPYHSGYYLDDWNSYALSIRVVVWMQQLNKRTEYEDKQRMLITLSLLAQIRFLTKNLELDIYGNHIIKNIKALLWAGAYFKGDEAVYWMKRGEQLLDVELQEQILNDGMHFELSPAYHAQVFADLLECYQVIAEGKVKKRLMKILPKMAQVLADMTQNDGYVCLFNDGGLNMAYPSQQCLSIFSQLTQKQVNKRQYFNYQDAGYIGFQDENNEIVVDCGALAPDYLPAHGHGDMFSFEWSIDKNRIIVDAGVYEYNTGEMRDYSRDTTSHNTVTLDSFNQSEFWKAFRVGRRAKIISRKIEIAADHFFIDAAHNGYAHLAGKPIHRRSFSYVNKVLHIEDEIQDGKGQQVTSRLLLNPECKVEKLSEKSVRVTYKNSVLSIKSNVAICDKVAWWCPNFGVKIPTTQLVIHYGKAPCTSKIRIESIKN
jgi:uncharacterized heparinase superfamily protein